MKKRYIVGKLWFTCSPLKKNWIFERLENMNVQWYPGHMTKAKRQMQEDIRLIDLIIELLDARVPLSSRNPDIDELGKNKSRLILLNKADLADERQNEAWKAYFQEKGFYVVKADSRNGSGMKAIQNVIQDVCKEKIERDRRRGSKTVRSALWWQGFLMWENPRLSIPLREKPAQRQATGPALPKAGSGFV